MAESFEERREELIRLIEEYTAEDVMVAFSGGVDSSLLLKLACSLAAQSGKNVYAVLLHTMLHPSGEVEEIEASAAAMGAKFLVLDIDELADADIESNPKDRCYRCKKHLFREVLREADRRDIRTVLEGTNEDDMHVYRPGIRAVRELGIKSPLVQAGFTKEDVRRMAGELSLLAAQKPSTPCLSTRFPYGTRLTYEAMRNVEMGEAFLKTLGLYNIRLRIHGDTARIETDPEDEEKILSHRKEVTDYLKKLGYTYITLDLEGFRSGSMDIHIEKK